MINSGLPSLLDAIFGKQNLALVSLDEIYEVIREFPSFNAGHFLLAKKLRLQDDPGYETESMRTALYFNNPFWLQSLLDDVNHFQPVESFSPVKESHDEEPLNLDEFSEEALDDIGESSNYTFESYTPVKQPDPEMDELDQETEEILDEKLETEEIVEEKLETEEIRKEKQETDATHSEETFQYAEPGSQTVTSFDELMAKYNLRPLDLVDETAETPLPALPLKEEAPSEPETVQTVIPPVIEMNADKSLASDIHQNEGLEEIVNEYGIFEETIVKKVDHDPDIDGFDEPLDQIPFVSDRIIEDPAPASQTTGSSNASSDADPVVENAGTADIQDEFSNADPVAVNMQSVETADESVKADPVAMNMHSVETADESVKADPVAINMHSVETADESLKADPVAFEGDAVDIQDKVSEEHNVIFENAGTTEHQEHEDPPHKTDEHDYESFDRPREEPVQIEVTSQVEENENLEEIREHNPYNASETVEYSVNSEAGENGQNEEQPEQPEEHQKMLSAFNAKNADSIVFTPYHMVDYFASQGIKLVLEDNPKDQFGKQLKSFTDWLKVMKKLPPRTSFDKPDEKENERIRHFAAHSIEERDILTESMAEVLAKQGMYENAIALFQKLSLIYPPKSAYFASRIEQLKASLP